MNKEEVKIIIGDNDIQEFPKFYKKYKDMKIIYGMKTNIDKKEIIILVKNKIGLRNLYKYVSHNILDDKKGLIICENINELSNYYDECEKVNIFPKDNIKLGNKNIREVVMNEANILYKNKIHNNILERIEEELDIIENNNYGGVYLLLKDIVKYNNDNGYHVMARGTIASSLIAYILKITDIDPMKYNIDVTNILDVDLNVASEFQHETIEFIKKELGDDRIFNAGVVVDEKRGKHPSGIIIVPNDLEIYDITPIKDNVTYFDYRDISSSTIKINILAHDYPTWIKALENETNMTITDIPFNDKNIFKALNISNITGIFDLERESLKKILNKYTINNFDDFIMFLSISHNEIDDKINYKYTTSDDIYKYLVSKKIDKYLSRKITTSIKLGKIKNDENWNRVKDKLETKFIKYTESIKYMVCKSHIISYALYDYYLLWYKYYYQDIYYKTYFEIIDNNPTIAHIQRKFKLGYNHALNIYNKIEKNNFVL